MALGDIIKSFSAPTGSITGLAWDKSSYTLWATDINSGILYQLSPGDGRIVRTITVSGSSSVESVSPNNGNGLWVLDGNTVKLISIEDGSIRHSNSGGVLLTGVTDIVFDGRALYGTGGNLTGQYFSVDDGSIIRAGFTISGNTRGITFTGHSLWITETNGDLIIEIDPNSGIVLRQFSSPFTTPRGLTFDGRSLWTVDVATDLIYQLSLE